MASQIIQYAQNVKCRFNLPDCKLCDSFDLHDHALELVILYQCHLCRYGAWFTVYFIYRRFGYENAIIAALVCGGRNVLLAYTITTPFMGTMFLPLIGAYQLPSFSLPLLGKKMVKWHNLHTK